MTKIKAKQIGNIRLFMDASVFFIKVN